jgi:hypothetical protein
MKLNGRPNAFSVYHIDADAFSVSRYASEDFIVRFRSSDDTMDVLRSCSII